MFRRVLIRKHERGLRFREGHFIAPLNPGQHTLFVPPWDAEFEKVETVDTLKTRFDHPMLDVIVDDSELREQLVVVDLTDTERAVVYRDGRVFALIGPGKHAFWKAPAEVKIEVFDVAQAPRLSHANLSEILSLPGARLFLDARQVAYDEATLVAVNGGREEIAAPGVHAFWRGQNKVRWMPLADAQSGQASGPLIGPLSPVALPVLQGPSEPSVGVVQESDVVQAAEADDLAISALVVSYPALTQPVRTVVAPRLRELDEGDTSIDAVLSRFGSPTALGLHAHEALPTLTAP